MGVWRSSIREFVDGLTGEHEKAIRKWELAYSCIREKFVDGVFRIWNKIQ